MTTTPLAFISDDASLQVAQISGDGADWEAAIEPRLDMRQHGMVFMWPTWSPQGDQLAVSASSQQRDEPKLELWRAPLDGASEDRSTVFQNPRDGRQVIAAGLAHYVHWSPSGRAVAVVGNVGSGLAVNLVAATGTNGDQVPRPQRLVDGAPLYFDWAPDGRAILVHRAAQLILFDLSSASEGPSQIQRARPSFRSPAWSSDGSAFFFARPRPGGGASLVRAKRNDVAAGREVDELLDCPGPVAFVRAPTDDRLAVLTLDPNDAEGRALTVLNPDSGVEQRLVLRAISGLTWAPDGRAIYVFEPMPSSTMISLSRYALDEGAEPRGQRLARFQPSAEFATMLSFHDQFAHSHQIVSPCGRWIAFSGLALGNGGAGRRGFGPQNGCYLVPSDGSAPPRRIAAGSIGFFPSAQSASLPQTTDLTE